MSRHRHKARDKNVQKFTRDGLISQNLSTGEERNISHREAEGEFRPRSTSEPEVKSTLRGPENFTHLHGESASVPIMDSDHKMHHGTTTAIKTDTGLITPVSPQAESSFDTGFLDTTDPISTVYQPASIDTPIATEFSAQTYHSAAVSSALSETAKIESSASQFNHHRDKAAALVVDSGYQESSPTGFIQDNHSGSYQEQSQSSPYQADHSPMQAGENPASAFHEDDHHVSQVSQR